MQGAELLNLADTIRGLDPQDHQTGAAVQERISSLQSAFERSHADDLAAYLDTCGHLVRLVTSKPTLEAEDIVQFVGRVVGAVADELGVSGGNVATEAPPAGPELDVAPKDECLYGELDTPTQESPILKDGATLPTLEASSPSSQPWRLMSRGFEEAKLRTATERLLGEIFLQLGMVTEEQLQTGLERQRASGFRIGESLVDLGYLTWDQVARAREVQKLLHRAAK